MAVEPIQERLKLVRAATRQTQTGFAALLDEAARRLYGAEATRYDQPLVSNLENADREVTIEDVAAYAAVDPTRRGKLWVAWGEEIDSTMQGEAEMPVESFSPRPRTPAKNAKRNRAS